jgi:predicted nucleotide-binding protein (sugar kinase/HSP70/actin superfamily)
MIEILTKTKQTEYRRSGGSKNNKRNKKLLKRLKQIAIILLLLFQKNSVSKNIDAEKYQAPPPSENELIQKTENSVE